MAISRSRPQEDLPNAEVGHFEVRDGITIADGPSEARYQLRSPLLFIRVLQCPKFLALWAFWSQSSLLSQ